MGYLHIDNLYKYPDIFLFKKVYALEKIHGTSAHVAWEEGKMHLFSGGEKPEKFAATIAAIAPDLADRFALVAPATVKVVVYGEAYGGKCQGMSGTYGKELKFVAFDVTINGRWLSVPEAQEFVGKLGLEFVHYTECFTDLADLDRERDAPSVQAKRNGIEEARAREGIVLRPLLELLHSDGSRVICKYKGEAFRETASPRPPMLAGTEMVDAKKIADEWVTPMRLAHILDKMPLMASMEHTGEVIKAMLEDVKREGAGEIVWTKAAQLAIGRATAQLFKRRMEALAAGNAWWTQ